MIVAAYHLLIENCIAISNGDFLPAVGSFCFVTFQKLLLLNFIKSVIQNTKRPLRSLRNVDLMGYGMKFCDKKKTSLPSHYGYRQAQGKRTAIINYM